MAPEQAPSCPASKSSAIEFIQEARFQTNPEIYQRFLQSFTEIYAPGKEPKTAEEGARLVQERMGDIFKGNQDLLEKFKSFLPHNRGGAGSTGTNIQDPAAGLGAEEVD
ncbi:hypothetical protein OQA88_4445 [Cercophora sp. LCS_1]